LYYSHPDGYFGAGPRGWFTPTDHFTFQWLFERLSYNIPFFINNFTQLIGTLPLISLSNEINLAVNQIFSIALFFIFSFSLIFFFLSNIKKNFLIVLPIFIIFFIHFGVYILLPYTDLHIYRDCSTILVLIHLSYFYLGDCLNILKKNNKRQILFTIPIMALTFISALGMALSLFLPGYDIFSFIKDNFTVSPGVPPGTK
ncbi:MAG: hypothetical protein ACTSXU_01560, partial [Promethearchaeota archaeon]